MMNRLMTVFILIALVLVGCHQNTTEIDNEKSNSTKDNYNDTWDSKPIIVKKLNESDDSKTINEIIETSDVKKLQKELKNADWEDNVDVEIRPADYSFTWNTYYHSVWVNEEHKKLSLRIEGQLNYVTLSKDSSKNVYEILTGESI